LHANKQDVGIALSLTSGMHSLLATLYKPNSKRFKIIMLESEFNSDIIAAESWLEINQAKEGLLLAKISDKDPQVALNNIIKLIEEHQDSVSVVAMSLVSSHFSHYYDINQIR
jgi:kynureninase